MLNTKYQTKASILQERKMCESEEVEMSKICDF